MHCALKTVYCTLYIVPKDVITGTAQCTLYTNTLWCAVNTGHCTQYSVHSILCTVKCTQYIVHCKLYMQLWSLSLCTESSQTDNQTQLYSWRTSNQQSVEYIVSTIVLYSCTVQLYCTIVQLTYKSPAVSRRYCNYNCTVDLRSQQSLQYTDLAIAHWRKDNPASYSFPAALACHNRRQSASLTDYLPKNLWNIITLKWLKIGSWQMTNVTLYYYILNLKIY